jgi:hypothetical protein
MVKPINTSDSTSNAATLQRFSTSLASLSIIIIYNLLGHRPGHISLVHLSRSCDGSHLIDLQGFILFPSATVWFCPCILPFFSPSHPQKSFCILA